jgi:hypothetical protein
MARAAVRKVRGSGDRTHLTLSGQEIDHLLNGTSTMHVERNRDKVASDGFADKVALVVGGILEQLLAEVIAKGICHKFRMCSVSIRRLRTRHQISEVAERLPKDDIAVLRDSLLQFLLQEAASVLVLAHSWISGMRSSNRLPAKRLSRTSPSVPFRWKLE